jgi:hypothetical protein
MTHGPEDRRLRVIGLAHLLAEHLGVPEVVGGAPAAGDEDGFVLGEVEVIDLQRVVDLGLKGRVGTSPSKKRRFSKMSERRSRVSK